ncbi:sensor domain-containing diguanylate cyclase [Vibrio sinaloensis]|uniref:sensor domain-containing diguanylate cyclase n=1 Tax=Photobacterium sp. (strain ATCC 43367) TaxID=379097 RepID=UPI00206D3FC6|nr:sensor domain-containing diguanylate cyclase [Vibrio sinaloensis]UPQ89185.1 diguanylate cyclase [Vibrio sinaloensis]
MRKQMEMNIHLSYAQRLIHPYYGNAKDHVEYGVWYLEKGSKRAPLQSTSDANPVAITSGFGSIGEHSEQLKHELHAALSLVVDVATAREDLEYIWAYYTSSQKFIHISPFVSLDTFHFTDDLLQKPFWLAAVPQNNPDKETVISELYEDAAGQGLMISISSPVYENNTFRGVVSLDIGLNRLNETLGLGNVPGESVLVDEHGQYLAKTSPFILGEKVFDWSTGFGVDAYYEEKDHVRYTIPIVPGEVYLVHRMSRCWDNIMMVVRQMALYMSLYSFSLLVIYLLVSLKITVNQLKELAEKDSLTSLLNRRTIEKLSQNLMKTQSTLVSCLMIDIDHFKRVNDIYGHYVGDRVIKSVADALSSNCQDGELIGRIGGEEFLIVLPYADVQRARNLAEQIRHKVSTKRIGEQGIEVTLSIGCAQRLNGEDYDTFIRRSDKALYQAKRQGRNRVVTAFQS